jgi:hypothetical protein
MEKDEVLAIFSRAKPNRRAQIILAVISLICGPVALLLNLVIFPKVIFAFTPIYLVTIIGLIYTGYALYLAFTSYNHARLMLRSIESGCHDLAWVYVEKGETTRLVYYFTNRKHGSLVIDFPRAQALCQFFARSYAHVTTGYSDALAERYSKSAADLQTHPAHTNASKTTTRPNPGSYHLDE